MARKWLTTISLSASSRKHTIVRSAVRHKLYCVCSNTPPLLLVGWFVGWLVTTRSMWLVPLALLGILVTIVRPVFGVVAYMRVRSALHSPASLQCINSTWLLLLLLLSLLLCLLLFAVVAVAVGGGCQILPFWGFLVSGIWGFAFLKHWERKNGTAPTLHTQPLAAAQLTQMWPIHL